jgi:hypothetical protein
MWSPMTDPAGLTSTRSAAPTSARRRDAGPASPRPRAVAARVLVGGPRARPDHRLRIYSEVGFGIPRKNTSRRWPRPPASTSSSPTARPSPRSTSPLPLEARPASSSARPDDGSPEPRLMDELVVQEHRIKHPKSGGIMRALSADGALQHGLNPSANIIDEIHAHKNPDLYTALTTGTGAREQPFTLWITTAGVAGQGILGSLYQSMFDGRASSRTAARSADLPRPPRTASSSTGTAPPRDADIADPPSGSPATRSATSSDGKYLASSTPPQEPRRAARVADVPPQPVREYEEAWLPAGAWACLPRRAPASRPSRPLRGPRRGVGIDRAQRAISPPSSSPSGRGACAS